jgi:hypothetical protein
MNFARLRPLLQDFESFRREGGEFNRGYGVIFGGVSPFVFNI